MHPIFDSPHFLAIWERQACKYFTDWTGEASGGEGKLNVLNHRTLSFGWQCLPVARDDIPECHLLSPRHKNNPSCYNLEKIFDNNKTILISVAEEWRVGARARVPGWQRHRPQTRLPPPRHRGQGHLGRPERHGDGGRGQARHHRDPVWPAADAPRAQGGSARLPGSRGQSSRSARSWGSEAPGRGPGCPVSPRTPAPLISRPESGLQTLATAHSPVNRQQWSRGILDLRGTIQTGEYQEIRHAIIIGFVTNIEMAFLSHVINIIRNLDL